MVVLSVDGACSGNPGRAGWAWVRHHDGMWQRGHLPRATNQVAELLALLHAITVHLHEPQVQVRSDSAYTIGTYTSWMDSAHRRGWTNSAGKPTSNRHIIETLMSARDARAALGLAPVELVKVKGHSCDGGNEAADGLAVAAKDDAVVSRFGFLHQPVNTA